MELSIINFNIQNKVINRNYDGKENAKLFTKFINKENPNIICVQPFACLPNHVVGKGVIKTIREKYPEANISPVDYDPGASEANQTNRIKLLMTVAKDNLKTIAYARVS